jgi:hypothetical protein
MIILFSFKKLLRINFILKACTRVVFQNFTPFFTFIYIYIYIYNYGILHCDTYSHAQLKSKMYLLLKRIEDNNYKIIILFTRFLKLSFCIFNKSGIVLTRIRIILYGVKRTLFKWWVLSMHNGYSRKSCEICSSCTVLALLLGEKIIFIKHCYLVNG